MNIPKKMSDTEINTLERIQAIADERGKGKDFLNHEYPHYVVTAMYLYYWQTEYGLSEEEAKGIILEAGRSMCQELTEETKQIINELIPKRYKINMVKE